MKLILPGLLAFAIFFSSIEPSSQQSSSFSSSQGTTGRRSWSEQRRNSRGRHSYAEESGESRISSPFRRFDLEHSSSQRQEVTSRYTGPGTRLPSQHSGPSNIRHSEALRSSANSRGSPPSPTRSHLHERHPCPARSGQASPAPHQQGGFSNSSDLSESTRRSTSYSYEPSSGTSFSASVDSPRGPFSFPYDSSSATSESGSIHNSPNHSP